MDHWWHWYKTEGMMAQLGPWEKKDHSGWRGYSRSILSLGIFHNPVSDFSPESLLVTPEMISSLNVKRVFKVEQVRKEGGEAPQYISQSPRKYAAFKLWNSKVTWVDTWWVPNLNRPPSVVEGEKDIFLLLQKYLDAITWCNLFKLENQKPLKNHWSQ